MEVLSFANIITYSICQDTDPSLYSFPSNGSHKTGANNRKKENLRITINIGMLLIIMTPTKSPLPQCQGPFCDWTMRSLSRMKLLFVFSRQHSGSGASLLLCRPRRTKIIIIIIKFNTKVPLYTEQHQQQHQSHQSSSSVPFRHAIESDGNSPARVLYLSPPV